MIEFEDIDIFLSWLSGYLHDLALYLYLYQYCYIYITIYMNIYMTEYCTCNGEFAVLK